MPISMLNLSRLQLFHLGQVKKQSILMNAKQHAKAQQNATISPGSGVREQPNLRNAEQHAQAQQTATISPGSGKSANASSMLKLNRLQLFHLGQVRGASHSEEGQAACTRSADVQ
jgi:hypothetical protein